MRKKIIFSLIILSVMLIIGQVSYAAVEIIPSKSGDGKDAIVNTTVSNSYLLCQGMKDTGGTLKGTSVKPHLATNKDWGAVSYLSNSIYGTNTQGGNTGVQVTINGVNYYSTTTNITGVMNWGSNPNKTLYTQTAGIVTTEPASSVSDNVFELISEIRNNSKYVELFANNSSQLGMATTETKQYPFVDTKINGGYSNYPISIRVGMFGYRIGAPFSDCDGAQRSNNTFRPVVWN